MNKFVNLLLTTLLLIGLSLNASATLMLNQYDSDTPTPSNIGGYTMTDFSFIDNSLATNNVETPFGDLMYFFDKYGDLEPLNNSTADDTSWWVNGESFNYDIYTTSLHLITFILPEDTMAFSFNVGANTTANAWLSATESNGSGIGKTYFGLSPTNTPGYSVYADPAGDCSTSITSITVDPTLIWGFGNFSMSQGNCATVPEPSIIGLLGFGLVGIIFTRRINRLRLTAKLTQ